MKIKSCHMVALYLLIGIVCLSIATVIFVLANSFVLTAVAAAFMGAGIVSLIMISGFINYIEVDNESIYVKDFPFLGSKRSLKNEQLKAWNSSILLSEIESFELVTLTSQEKKQFIGLRHIFSKYLKLKIKNSDDCKYIYASVYSKKQIQSLLNVTDKRNISKI